MSFDKSVSLGNLISWGIMLAGFLVGYGAMSQQNKQTFKDAQEAKTMAVATDIKVTATDLIRSKEVSSIQVDMATVKANLANQTDKMSTLERKIDILLERRP